MTSGERRRIQRAEMIQRMLDQGYKQVAIANYLGVSKQALGQMIKRYKASGLL